MRSGPRAVTAALCMQQLVSFEKVARRHRGAYGPRGGLLRARSLRVTVKTTIATMELPPRAERPRDCVTGLI